MKKQFSYLRSIYRGDSIARIMMHDACKHINVANKNIIDIGSGSKPAAYYKFFMGIPSQIVPTDIKNAGGVHTRLDLECDQLPAHDNTYDMVCAFNILEHIFSFNFVCSEMYRVLKPQGDLVGFVPFMVNYHPDPHDYFRYTEEALLKIFTEHHFRDIVITPIGGSAWLVGFNSLMLSVPRIVRVIIFPFIMCCDYVFRMFRPSIGKRYPLGYFFTAKK